MPGEEWNFDSFGESDEVDFDWLQLFGTAASNVASTEGVSWVSGLETVVNTVFSFIPGGTAIVGIMDNLFGNHGTGVPFTLDWSKPWHRHLYLWEQAKKGNPVPYRPEWLIEGRHWYDADTDTSTIGFPLPSAFIQGKYPWKWAHEAYFDPFTLLVDYEGDEQAAIAEYNRRMKLIKGKKNGMGIDFPTIVALATVVLLLKKN